jgi:hypothetical protein
MSINKPHQGKSIGHQATKEQERMYHTFLGGLGDIDRLN